jgi:hypothetical protein
MTHHTIEMLFPAALLMGLFGAPHCFAMCGGLSVALGLGQGGGQLRRRLLVHTGRLLGYASLGAAAASLGTLPGVWYGGAQMMVALRIGAGLMLVVTGLAMLGWAQRLLPRAWAPRIGRLLGTGLHRLRQGHSAWRDVLTGMLWGLLPCGLVYAALGLALFAGHPAAGALGMGLFWLGTLPAMLGLSWSAAGVARFFAERSIRELGGAVFIACGLFTMVAAVSGHGSHQTTCEAPAMR